MTFNRVSYYLNPIEGTDERDRVIGLRSAIGEALDQIQCLFETAFNDKTNRSEDLALVALNKLAELLQGVG